ncbi:MAG: hypothetical protein J1E34_08505 [Oscillospiraceae bacterium]|nr:hypothetical protein [Oscillospiraceae bacterium]
MKGDNAKKLKKTKTIISIIAWVIALTAVWQFTGKTITEGRTLAYISGARQTLIAHRGFSALYPQNTVPAFIAAAENGFDGYEFDVHTTKDGVWVVIHNDDIDAMTNGTGNVADYTYEELMRFNIDAGNGIENYPDLKIPTLEEALSVCDEYDIFPVIEIKSCDSSYFPGLLAGIYSHSLQDKAIIISFTMEYLEEIRALDGNIEMSYLSSKLTRDDVDKCVSLGNCGIDINIYKFFKMTGAIKYAQDKGLKCVSWTIDHPLFADISHWIGIDNITTNRIRHK